MMGRYIDPTTDFGFKRLFGQEDSKAILAAFLEAILDLPSPIADLAYIPAEQLPAAAEERRGIYDVYCVDAEGQRFIVEMQRTFQVHFRERSLYYATFPIVHQVRRGETQFPYLLLPVYVIGVLNFAIDSDPRHRRRIQLCDVATGQPFYPKLTLVYLELPKFAGKPGEGLSPADQWVYLLKHLPALADIPAELAHEPFTLAFARAEEAALSPAERERYERSRKDDLDERSRLYSAQLVGRREGVEKVARGLLAQGVDRAVIQQATGLSADDLDALAAATPDEPGGPQ